MPFCFENWVLYDSFSNQKQVCLSPDGSLAFLRTLFHSSTYSHGSVLLSQTVPQAASPWMLRDANISVRFFFVMICHGYQFVK